MLKKYVVSVFFIPVVIVGMNRQFNVIRAPEFEDDMVELESGQRSQIEYAITDILNGRTTSNYRLLDGKIGEYTFRNGCRLYFARENGIVVILGCKFKKNEKKQSMHIQEMANRLDSVQQCGRQGEVKPSDKDLQKKLDAACLNMRIHGRFSKE